MTIVYLGYARIPSRAANGVQTVKMCGAFASQGHKVTLYAREGDAPGEAVYERYGIPTGQFEIRTFPERGFRGIRTAAFLWDVHRDLRKREKPDLYFARDVLVLASVAHHGVPMIYEAHQIPNLNSRADRLFAWLSRRPNFKSLIAITERVAAAFRERYPALANRPIQVSPGAADELVFEPSSDPWPGRPGARQIGYVGHLYEGRGIDTIVAAAAEMPDCDFHIVGGWPVDIERWKQEGIYPNVYFHGYVPHTRLGWFYRHFDVLTAPYHTKVYSAGREHSDVMSPLKLFEYMAAGKPIVCSDLPILREVLRDGENAVLVPPSDRKAFVAALRKLEEDSAMADSIAATARRQFELHYTWGQRAHSLLASV